MKAGPITIENCHLHIGTATHVLNGDVLWPGADLIEVYSGKVVLRRDPVNEHQWLLVEINGATVIPGNGEGVTS